MPTAGRTGVGNSGIPHLIMVLIHANPRDNSPKRVVYTTKEVRKPRVIRGSTKNLKAVRGSEVEES